MLKTNLNTPKYYNLQQYQPAYSIPVKHAPEKQDNVSFKGHIGSEKAPQKAVDDTASNGLKWLVHETCLFRDTETNNFVKDYILQNFLPKEKIEIIVGACSSGEEAVTQSMLLNEIKNKVNILAFDLSEQSIKEAKSRKYLFQKTVPAPKGYNDSAISFHYKAFQDTYLWNTPKEELTQQQKEYKKLFEEFFEPIGEAIPPEKKSFSLKYREWLLKKMFKIWPPIIEGQYFKLKDNMADNIKFIQGNILNTQDLMKGKKADVFFFRNAMYHLITEDIANGQIRRLKPDAENTIRRLATQIKDNLNEKGIFVLGEEEWLQTMDIRTVPGVLKELGFKPIYTPKEGIPTVWQVCHK